ncbi:hypothetical protein B0T26DRAFT_717078 [Lasiosphaeria miniovina]|uniref:ferric-chelate reductase (NADPH) n=1 Tax=Lasiosphaeria miniovina TaxID=1954250 RepID=A0AA40ACF7_9PEZI|nr:uncharacterized protein B0T26DRAFT_717078 [Lasiosphaeria miniovina]KAK0713310.1 hypothetical protein B0T26DRAFT_717078 [Lasiosphaeria miniovina]
MPRVKYGFAAGAVLVWTALSSLLPLRRRFFGFFVLQHRASSLAFVSLLYCHLPRGHRFYAYCAFAASAADSATSWLQFAYRNLHLRRPPCCNGRHTHSLGYEANVVAIGHGLSVLEVNGVHFDWAPGQYVSIWAPMFWWQSTHPFTIASSSSPGPGAAGSCRRIVLMMRTKGSFTESMNRHARASEPGGGGGGGQPQRLRLFVSGPFGRPPGFERFETVVCISASTGASFTLPIVQSLAPLGSKAPPAVRRLHILMLARERAELDFYVRRLRQLMQDFTASGIVVDVTIAVTGGARPEHAAASPDAAGSDDAHSHMDRYEPLLAQADALDDGEYPTPQIDEPGGLLRSSAESDIRSLLTQSLDSPSDEEQDMAILDPHHNGAKDESSAGYFFRIKGRPDLDQYLDHIMDSTCGRLGISVCGGSGVVAGVREALKAVCCRRKGDGQKTNNVFLHVEGSST